MNKGALIESLMSTFVEEVAEHVSSFNRDLLALEGGEGNPEGLLQSLFRTAHNLKGAARAVDVGLVESACHALEDILARARDGERPLEPEAFEVLYATADAIQDAGARLKEKQSLAASPLAAVVSRLVAVAPGGGARPVAPLPSAPPLPATPARQPMVDRRDGDTLRVSAEKLDTVLARSGELLLAVRQTERRCTEWATLEDAASGLVADFRRLQTLVSASVAGEARAAFQQVGAGIDKLKEGLERAVAGAAAGGRGLVRTA